MALWDRWVLAQTRQEACDRLETAVMRPSGTRDNKTTKQKQNSLIIFILSNLNQTALKNTLQLFLFSVLFSVRIKHIK
jgi:hypothetical protein